MSPTLKTELSRVQWPAYYLDFETVMTALPLYPDTAPYTQVPTQYSVHICSALGKVVTHKEFLAPDPTKDCRRLLAEQLVADLGSQGSVLAYHAAFKSTVIKNLAAMYPDLAPSLNAIIARMLDLEAFVLGGFYHPRFHGSSSIKVVLPVMVPTMSYSGLAIGDGDAAVAQFARMAKGQCGVEESKELRKALLTYCEQDTLAMVKLHEQLIAYATD